jgi:hypothetical protein
VMGAQPLGLAKSEQDIAERQPQLVVTVLASTTGSCHDRTVNQLVGLELAVDLDGIGSGSHDGRVTQCLNAPMLQLHSASPERVVAGG